MVHVELTPEEAEFLKAMLSGATIQGAENMRRLVAILDKLGKPVDG